MASIVGDYVPLLAVVGSPTYNNYQHVSRLLFELGPREVITHSGLGVPVSVQVWCIKHGVKHTIIKPRIDLFGSDAAAIAIKEVASASDYLLLVCPQKWQMRSMPIKVNSESHSNGK